jgi:hypothetical protein
VNRAALIACLCACGRRAPITSCDQDLSGEYEGESRRWMIVDRGDSLDGFALFPDVPASELEVAPRAIEWNRDGTHLRGHVTRRYMQGATICVTDAPATIASCNNDMLEVVLGDPPSPLRFSPCQQSRADPTRRERWIRRP